MGVGAIKRAVFLDRDGVLNEAVIRDGKPYPPATASEVRIVSGAPEAMATLKELGLSLIVVTNQPDVARGTQSGETVEAIHQRIGAALPVDDFLTCTHDDADGCACRKPKPGLILDGAARHGVDLRRSFMVGDRWRDIDAGHAAGCRTVWIDSGYRERGPSSAPDATVRSIAEAAHWIAERVRSEENGESQPHRVSAQRPAQ
jgi:D-glycero-D-manno-heptose 1,7-bisphosphate phosphatase